MDQKDVSENEEAAIEGTDETPLQAETVDNSTQPCNPPQGPYSKKLDELEALLENLQGKLSYVVLQIDYVNAKTAELCAVAHSLEKSPVSCGDSTDPEEGQEKKIKDVLFEIKTRKQVLKILEKKEVLLSHAILSVVSNWADEMEKNLKTSESTKPVQEDLIQPNTESAQIMSN